MTTNGHGPTPAERIRALTMELVELPKLSAKAGEPVRVLIRTVDATAEYLPLIRDLPTMAMEPEDRQAYILGLDEAGREALHRRHFEADKALIALAVLAPRVTEQDSGEPGTVPMHALLPDRIVLVRKILELSQLLATPSPPPQTPGPAEVPGVTEEAFRSGLDAPPGDGGAVEPAAVRDPGAPAG